MFSLLDFTCFVWVCVWWSSWQVFFGPWQVRADCTYNIQRNIHFEADAFLANASHHHSHPNPDPDACAYSLWENAKSYWVWLFMLRMLSLQLAFSHPLLQNKEYVENGCQEHPHPSPLQFCTPRKMASRYHCVLQCKAGLHRSYCWVTDAGWAPCSADCPTNRNERPQHVAQSLEDQSPRGTVLFFLGMPVLVLVELWLRRVRFEIKLHRKDYAVHSPRFPGSPNHR